MSPWAILGDVIGWIVLVLVIVFAALLLWSMLVVLFKPKRGKATRIFSSKDE